MQLIGTCTLLASSVSNFRKQLLVVFHVVFFLGLCGVCREAYRNVGTKIGIIDVVVCESYTKLIEKATN